MTKKELETKTNAVIETIRSVLRKVFEAHNQGQQKKLLKNEDVADIFVQYGVIETEEVSD